jgi:hypothetical protein
MECWPERVGIALLNFQNSQMDWCAFSALGVKWDLKMGETEEKEIGVCAEKRADRRDYCWGRLQKDVRKRSKVKWCLAQKHYLLHAGRWTYLV